MNLLNIFTKAKQPSEVEEDQGISSTSIDNQGIFKAYIPEYLYRPPYGMPRKENTVLLKKLAKNPYIFSVIKTLVDEARSVGWDIRVKKDFQDNEEDYSDKIKEVTRFFNNPNGNNQSFEDIQGQAITDLCECDSGVFVKVFNREQKFVQLFARDGSLFLKNPDIYGYMGDRAEFVPPITDEFVGINLNKDTTMNPKQQETVNKFDLAYKQKAAYFQYGWTAGSMPVPFGKREIVYMMQNSRSDSIYGRSPIKILASVIQNLIYGVDFNLDYFTKNSMPEGVISLLGAKDPQISQFRANFENQFKYTDEFGTERKKFFKFPILNREVKFTPFQISPKELDIISQQEWFTKIVWMCYSDDTEILTETGWKLFKDLDRTEKVARVNKDNLNMDFVKPIDYQEYEYKGDMIRYLTKNIDLKVTPEHNMLFQTKDKFSRGLGWDSKKASEIDSGCIVIPQAVNYKGTKLKDRTFGDITFTGLQFAKFMGYWLGDGWADSCDNRVSFAVSKIVYPENYKNLTELFKEIGITWKENEYSARWTENPMNTLRFSNKELNRYLKQFGKARDKYVPAEIINSTEKEMSSFLEYYMFADGCEGRVGQNTRYFSMSKQLIEDCQIMYLRMGIASNINEWNGGYELTERKSKIGIKKNYSFVEKSSIIKEAYDGKVYDVTVPEHHYLVVRRNGRVSISGNCFGVTSEEMGFTENSNKATGETQTKLAKRKALQPLLKILSYNINTQILPEFFTDDLSGDILDFGDVPIEFVYNDEDLDNDVKIHNLLEQEIRMGVKTPKMVAKELGIDIIELEESLKEKTEEDKDKFEFENSFNAPFGGDVGKKEDKPKEEVPKKEDKKKEKPKQEEKSIKDPLKEIDDHIDSIGEALVNAIDSIQ